MRIVRLPAYISLIYCAVSSYCAAPSEHAFFLAEDGYVSRGKELLVAPMNVSQAKELCVKLEGCKAFHHHGDVDIGSRFDMHFWDSDFRTVNSDDTYTTYVLRVRCTASDFDHCPSNDNVRCCDTSMTIPQCGNSREDCEARAEATHCSEFEHSRCPYFGETQCCDKNGRCVVTDDCSKHQAATYSTGEIVLYASLVSLGLVGVLLILLCVSCCHDRKFDGGIRPGYVVTYHDSRRALLGTVGAWDNGKGLWEVRLRGGTVVHAKAENLIIVEQTDDQANNRRSLSEEVASEMTQALDNSRSSLRMDELGIWDYSNSSFQISIEGDQIMFAEGCFRAALVRGAEWLEGDVVSSKAEALQAGEKERVRLRFLGKVKAFGKDEILLNSRMVGESDWSDVDVIAVRRSS